MKLCSIPGCSTKHMARELCQKHYNALYHATVRKRASTKSQLSVYPQSVVRVSVKGWGFLVA